MWKSFISSIMLFKCEGLLFLYVQEGWHSLSPRWLESICDFICTNNFILISTCSEYYMDMHNAQSIYSSLATVTIRPPSKLTLVKRNKTHKTEQKQKEGWWVALFITVYHQKDSPVTLQMRCSWQWTVNSTDQITLQAHRTIALSSGSLSLSLSFPLFF
jgi:hypothetical protein